MSRLGRTRYAEQLDDPLQWVFELWLPDRRVARSTSGRVRRARYMIAIMRDRYFIRSKGLSSVTEFKRFDEAGESSGKNSDIIRWESPR